MGVKIWDPTSGGLCFGLQTGIPSTQNSSRPQVGQKGLSIASCALGVLFLLHLLHLGAVDVLMSYLLLLNARFARFQRIWGAHVSGAFLHVISAVRFRRPCAFFVESKHSPQKTSNRSWRRMLNFTCFFSPKDRVLGALRRVQSG